MKTLVAQILSKLKLSYIKVNVYYFELIRILIYHSSYHHDIQYDHFILMMLAAEWVWPFLDMIGVLRGAPYSWLRGSPSSGSRWSWLSQAHLQNHVSKSQNFPRSLHIPRRPPLPPHWPTHCLLLKWAQKAVEAVDGFTHVASAVACGWNDPIRCNQELFICCVPPPNVQVQRRCV